MLIEPHKTFRTTTQRRDGDTHDVYYRYVDHATHYIDDFGDLRTAFYSVKLETYVVVRYTPKGATIRVPGGTRFVSRHTRKQFAHPNEADALRSYIARKERQIGIYRARAAHAESYLRMARDMLPRVEPVLSGEDRLFYAKLVDDKLRTGMSKAQARHEASQAMKV